MPLTNFTLDVDGQHRQVLMHIPPGDGQRPAVVLLHGSGGTGLWALRETRWDELADREGCVIVCPDATRPHPDLPIRFYTNPPAWNDGSNRPPADRILSDDIAFLRILFDQLPLRAIIDPRRIFVTGFSNGAAMTFRAAGALSERIRAIAPVAGHCWPTVPTPARPVPTLFLTGALDPLIPPTGGQVDTPWAKGIDKPAVRDSLRNWAERLGMPIEPATIRDDGLVMVERYGELLEAWTIAGLGHHWPGGRGELNPRIAGPPSYAIDATEVIWDFFQRF